MKKLILIVLAFAMLAGAPTTTVVTAAWTTICDTGRIAQESNTQFKVHNVGANPFTDCRVQSWVGPLTTDWKDIDIDWTECLTLAADASSIWEIAGSSHEQIRVQAKSAAGTSAYCRPSGN